MCVTLPQNIEGALGFGFHPRKAPVWRNFGEKQPSGWGFREVGFLFGFHPKNAYIYIRIFKKSTKPSFWGKSLIFVGFLLPERIWHS